MIKIAVPVTENGQLDGHFGHCAFYEIYTISDKNEIENVKTLKAEQGCGCKSNIASVLAENGVTVMLASGIGEGAINVLNSWNIQVVRGCSGKPSEVVISYVKGNISDSGESCSQHGQHHGDGDDHVCSH